MNIDNWENKEQTIKDSISLFTANGMASTLNIKDPFKIGSELPPCWHWLYFLDRPYSVELTKDGHRKKGKFLPPIDLPRRMYAGGKINFYSTLHIGDKVVKNSKVINIEEKTGKTGQLTFVKVRHTISKNKNILIEDVQDIVYRPISSEESSNTLEYKVPSLDFSHEIIFNPVTLFRYSALTFNSHRIHYDYPYVTKEEGYSGLIVHGPLLATFLANASIEQFQGLRLNIFEFRSKSPCFADTLVYIEGSKLTSKEMDLWIRDKNNILIMSAKAKFK